MGVLVLSFCFATLLNAQTKPTFEDVTLIKRDGWTYKNVSLTLGLEAVRHLDESSAQAVTSSEPVSEPETGVWAWHEGNPGAEPEIDLRGESGEEGWHRLDRLIDRAIPAGLQAINVIHGFGTGKLRDHLHARLKSDPRVATFEEAGPGQGGGGATRVFLDG